MNRFKRFCALLLAIVLTLGVALQPAIGSVFAEKTEESEPITEPSSEQAAEPIAESTEPMTEPTEPATESAEPMSESTEPAESMAEPTEPTVESTEPTSEPTELATESAKPMTESTEPTEPAELATEPAAESTAEPEPTEPEGFPWEGMTDEEFAAWLMDAANAETVKPFLVGGSVEYAALTARIGEISDPALNQQVSAYLTTLRKDEYIYFDLAAGSVTIGKDTYSGFVFVNGAPQPVSGTHADGNKYYVYQSTDTNKAQTGYAETQDYNDHAGCRVPTYNRVSYGGELWTDYITNNTNVYEVSRKWETAATDFGRTVTFNNITFASESNYTADVTIDNIWTKYQDPGRRPNGAVNPTYRISGGIGANLKNTGIDCENVNIYLRMKGDNRVGCVHYSAGERRGNSINFINGDSDETPGSITVADFPDGNKWNGNHWNAVIGGADNPARAADKSDGIVIESGYIYAGATYEDNCTAIGGGGNDYGGVTINGGTVTAVTGGTGTAIGGGIGYSDPGGNTDILITGGTIYAYNLGLKDNVGDTFAKFVPAAAIGGGGSQRSAGGLNANITINGGTIYAQSMGGPGIGGGGSANSNGGGATININGGTIIAKSIGGTYNGVEFLPGVSIGGGTGATSGGSVKLTITKKFGNPTIRTGSIGGGKATKEGAPIGYANVTISGGDITGQVIMMGSTGTGKCTFDMSDGKIHGSDVVSGYTITESLIPKVSNVDIAFIEKNGGAVWMQDENGVTNISGGTIEGCTAYRGGAVYMEGGTFTLSGSGTIQNNTARIESTDVGTTGRGGAVYVTGGTANINGGSIKTNNAQVRGGGLYVTSDAKTTGTVKVTGGSIQGNTAGFDAAGNSIRADVGRGGGVYLEGGLFTMTGGDISGNHANYRGGGIFLTKKPTLTKGIISGNTAKDSGGGLCINGDELELPSTDMQIFGNQAKNGGGVAVLNGNFILSGGAVGVEGAMPNTATEKGGGVFVEADSGGNASATVKNGNIWYNNAKEGGGLYLAKGEGDFTLDGENASISHNTAENGGGVYLYKDPALNQGKIEANEASGNGGGMYISDCLVTLNPSKDVTITENQAQKGAGIYIHGSSTSSENPDTPAVQTAGLLVDSGVTGTVLFTDNIATESGGAVCIDDGYFDLKSDHITVTGNRAKNGGGVAVLKGNFTMENGAIGKANGANTATANGGGVYVADGEVLLTGGSLEYNEATDGGGVYVANGDVTIVDGEISHNSASNDGGGFFISAGDTSVNVEMLSGKLNNNTAGANGGGMAVESNNDKTILVEIGCLEDHNVLNGAPRLPISYEGEDYGKYTRYGQHEYCPEVKYNQAGKIGGGFYMNSDASSLYFYCVEETANTAQSNNSGGMDVLGGNVSIGDYHYHNHEYNATNPDEDRRENEYPWGYISMDDATLVNGGKVDIYGDMTNPFFKNEVTVDIKDKTNDHFLDHRRALDGEKRYKVHYIENFFGTGLYQAFQYDESNAVITIKGTLYSHPGYQILGWYTKADYNPAEEDPDNQFYPVGESFDLRDSKQVPQMGEHSTDCDQCGEGNKDSNLLELYAIWEANGYTVVFDPNVPQGDTYTGSMDDQIHQYGVEKALTKNAYQYPGHIFNGWNMQADGTGTTTYADGEVVSNLTNKNGEKIVLYAQWELCDHTDHHRWSYEVTADKKTLVRICSCGGQTLTATLYAEDTVYDGLPHPAALTLDDEAAWGSDAPTIAYTGAWLDDGLDHTGTSPAFADNGQPLHAGEYEAYITKVGIKAFVPYIINKADQPAPDEVTYTVQDGSSDVVIDRIAPNTVTDKNNVPHTAEAEYRLSYYVDGVLHTTDWKRAEGEGTTVTITMENAWTSYNVEARYQELDDYNPSDVTRADAVYHYTGNVTVKIICDEGIDAYFEAKLTETDKKFDGAKLRLTTKEGYYLVGGDYDVKAELVTTTETTNFVPPKNDGIYSFTAVPDNSTLTITIGTTKKSPQVAAQVMPGQKFTPFTGIETAISRDSAFTAAFQIGNFDPSTYDAPKLTFGSEIPTNTTIILLNRKDKSYWYYRAAAKISSVPLTDFTKMGESERFAVPTAGESGYIDLSYQFIVDFSQCAHGDLLEGDLTMTLEAPIKDSSNAAKAPEVKSSVHIAMKDSTFKFEKTPETSSLTNSFTCTFTEGAAASKWENRASALVLTPKGEVVLPPDACIKAEVNGGTTYLYKSGASFIVPQSLLQAGEKTIKLTLQSVLFPSAGGSYSFTAQWLISPSKTGKAPMNGDQADELLDVTFISPERKVPSLKTEGADGQGRSLSSGDTLKLTVKTKNMDGDSYTISAALLRKSEDGKFSGTGWNQTNVSEGNLSVPLGGQAVGSYCLMLTVKEKDSITIIMEVPFYFVIKPTQ